MLWDATPGPVEHPHNGPARPRRYGACEGLRWPDREAPQGALRGLRGGGGGVWGCGGRATSRAAHRPWPCRCCASGTRPWASVPAPGQVSPTPIPVRLQSFRTIGRGGRTRDRWGFQGRQEAAALPVEWHFRIIGRGCLGEAPYALDESESLWLPEAQPGSVARLWADMTLDAKGAGEFVDGGTTGCTTPACPSTPQVRALPNTQAARRAWGAFKAHRRRDMWCVGGAVRPQHPWTVLSPRWMRCETGAVSQAEGHEIP